MLTRNNMKKYLLLLFILVVIFIGSNVYAKVPVYMVTREGCPACETALKYFKKVNRNNSELIDLYVFEVFNSKWETNSEELKTVYDLIYESIGADPNLAQTPTIVIGNYNVQGFPKDESIVYDAINDYEEDKIEALLLENNIDISKYKYEFKSLDILYVTGISIIFFCGIVGLVIIGNNKKNNSQM